MKNFDLHRFSQALKCQFRVERKTWIRLFGIFTLVMFMANLFFTRIQGNSFSLMVKNWGMEEAVRQYNHYVELTVTFGMFFFAIAMLFGATNMFSQMKDTRKRSAYLLWPVSNLEKYVVSFLLSVLLMAVLSFGAYMLADALRVLVDWLSGRVVIWGIPKLAEPFAKNAAFEEWRPAWMFFAWVFYVHSLYIVGGTLFRRQQFLLTSGAIVVVIILLTMISHQIPPQSQFDLTTGTWDEKTLTYTKIYHPAFYLLNSVVTLLIPFHYWLSYKIFCRMQVINNKWLNV